MAKFLGYFYYKGYRWFIKRYKRNGIFRFVCTNNQVAVFAGTKKFPKEWLDEALLKGEVHK